VGDHPTHDAGRRSTGHGVGRSAGAGPNRPTDSAGCSSSGSEPSALPGAASRAALSERRRGPSRRGGTTGKEASGCAVRRRRGARRRVRKQVAVDRYAEMDRVRVGVVGASGYSGAVAARLVAIHPELSLTFATSDKLAGESVGAQIGARVDPGLRFVGNGTALDHADRCDAVLLATSAEVSMRLLPAFAERGKQVVDLSGAFRLEAGEYPRWYGFEHAAPAWLTRAHYGLPEMFGAPAGDAIVSNPGCYPTAALLAIAPLVRERLIEPAGIIIDAKSGVTGAGRQSSEPFSFGEYAEDTRAYRLLAHQHTPEIVRALSRIASGVQVTFTAHYIPVKRGILVSCYGRPRPGASAARVAECLATAYRGSGFVQAMAADQVMLKRVVGTNACHVGATADDDVVIAVGAIDNLLKGASGQAIQNLNLMNGWDEVTGLDGLQRFSP
jgi:N-acetyl-gamma-glutamyl-phosphate reductase